MRVIRLYFHGGSIIVEQSSWVVSLFAPGALCGCYVGQILNEKVGRRFTVIILFSRTPWVMCISRFVTGIGMGITAVK
ncbi:unnamed protein product [Leptidea sinapis]|uniref:Uncharacterized protein n=1 Tax=Leptidea sinapis TaxID=189913 RepID=A0A5E4R2D9_9NEOP|nr:unnamed protein product [Leptidea sinapis]